MTKLMSDVDYRNTELTGKLVLSVTSIFVTALAIMEPMSLNHQMVEASGLPGMVAVLLLGFAGVFSLLDAMFNGFRNVVFPRLKRVRQNLWLFMGVVYVLYTYVLWISGMSLVLSLAFLSYSLASFGIAYLDAYEETIATRLRGVKTQKQESTYGETDAIHETVN